MDVFELRGRLIEDYERFSCSFTQIRAEDIRDAVEAAYSGGRFWPAPLIQTNPNFVPGARSMSWLGAGLLDVECGKIFRIKPPEDTFSKINEKTAYRLAAEGKLPGFQVGGSWRFDRQEISNWIKRQIEGQRGESPK